MDITVLIQILLGGTASAIVALVTLLAGWIARKKKPEKTYSERLSELTESLTKASTEVDEILGELATVAQEREETMQKLETEIASMEQHEQQTKQRIEALEQAPTVAKHFEELIKSGQKRSAYRDYLLFGAGVIVTTVASILIQVIAK